MSNLPKINDLYNDKISIRKSDAFVTLMNQPPLDKWVKQHPFIKNYNYLPIERIEFLLKTIFKQYKIEVLKTGLLLNAVEVTVRVHYVSPITGEWLFHDGTGAQEMQTQKDSGNLKLDMSNINRGAVTMALPIAKTLAIKDACDHFGKLFGCDLNRKDNISYTLDLTLIELTPEHPNWKKVKDALESKNYTIADIKSKYELSTENEKILCSK